MRVNPLPVEETFVSRGRYATAPLDQLRRSLIGVVTNETTLSLATPIETLPVVMKGVTAMPRRADPKNEVGRSATERWREGLRTAAVPEACHVDTAIAAAVSVALARLQETGEDLPAPIKSVVADALRILESRGYDAAASKRKTMSRLLYRRDRAALRKSAEKASRSKSL
jgi:hypothetical protein